MKDFLSLRFLATTSPPFHNVVGRNAIVNAAESLKGQLVATTVVSSSGVGGEGGGMADKRRPQGRANRHVGGGGRGGLDSHLAVFPAPSPCSVVITRICGAVSRHQEKWHRPLDGGGCLSPASRSAVSAHWLLLLPSTGRKDFPGNFRTDHRKQKPFKADERRSTHKQLHCPAGSKRPLGLQEALGHLIRVASILTYVCALYISSQSRMIYV